MNSPPYGTGFTTINLLISLRVFFVFAFVKPVLTLIQPNLKKKTKMFIRFSFISMV